MAALGTWTGRRGCPCARRLPGRARCRRRFLNSWGHIYRPHRPLGWLSVACPRRGHSKWNRVRPGSLRQSLDSCRPIQHCWGYICQQDRELGWTRVARSRFRYRWTGPAAHSCPEGLQQLACCYWRLYVRRCRARDMYCSLGRPSFLVPNGLWPRQFRFGTRILQRRTYRRRRFCKRWRAPQRLLGAMVRHGRTVDRRSILRSDRRTRSDALVERRARSRLRPLG